MEERDLINPGSPTIYNHNHRYKHILKQHYTIYSWIGFLFEIDVGTSKQMNISDLDCIYLIKVKQTVQYMYILINRVKRSLYITPEKKISTSNYQENKIRFMYSENCLTRHPWNIRFTEFILFQPSFSFSISSIVFTQF
jgi:hypothetical protein